MPSHNGLYGLPPGILVAVQQHADEEGRLLAAGQVEQRGSGQMAPEIGRGDAEKFAWKTLDVMKSKSIR
jgi:hypothetical protein